MKIVCVCQGGNSRSVGMAYILKSRGHAAVPIGFSHAHDGLMELLCNWADRIVVMESYIQHHIPQQFHSKMMFCDVGPDSYFLGYKQELMVQCEHFADCVLR
jgi:hypothetical protein